MPTPLKWMLAGALLLAVTLPVAAEPPTKPGLAGKADAAHSSSPRHETFDTTPPNPLPAPATTSHVLTLPGGRTLHFTATAGAIRLSDAQSGSPMADIGYVAFKLDGADVTKRPITVAMNGGPGASSAWLDLGALGPWRLPMEGVVSPSATGTLVDNADTWLDFTDLVFIDPPGTGYSRILSKNDEVRHRLYSIDGDINALSVAVRKWLTENNRLESPKFFVGESYGGFRGPLLARHLQDQEGIGLSGLVLVSPLLDRAWFQGANDPLVYVSRLPSLVASARNLGGTNPRAALADVEAYATGPYLSDLLRGERDPAALDRLTQKVAALTHLDPKIVRDLGGRVDMRSYARAIGRADEKLASVYDSRILAYDPEPHSATREYSDPVLDAIKTPLASTMADITANRLDWKVDARYESLNESVSREWKWTTAHGGVEAVSDLKRILATDPHMRVLIVHGVTDQVTPYFASKLLIDQVPPMGDPNRLRLAVYGGGHMLYAEDDSRAALREDARKLIEGK